VVGVAGGEFSDTQDDGFYGKLQLEWYATDDLMLAGGVEYTPSLDAQAVIHGEYQPGYYAMPGLTFFADGATGGNDYSRILLGLKVYFGSPKSLKDRHRFDTFAEEGNKGSDAGNEVQGDEPIPQATPQATPQQATPQPQKSQGYVT